MTEGPTPARRWQLTVDEYESLLGRPLLPAQANRLESLAVTLGKQLEWQHIDLNDNEWREGRKHTK